MIKFDPQDLTAYQSVRKRIVTSSVLSDRTQLSLFSYPHQRRDNRRYLIGDYYELLTTAIFGGNRRDWHDMIQPDVSNGFVLYEVKSLSWNAELKLAEAQADKYNREFKAVYYVVYKYTLRHPMATLGGLNHERYFDILSKNTGFCIKMPLNLVNMLIESGSDNLYKYFCDFHGPITRISSSFIKLLLIDPGAALRNCFHVPSGEFRFTKRCLPDGVSIDGFPVKPFPILLIDSR